MEIENCVNNSCRPYHNYLWQWCSFICLIIYLLEQKLIKLWTDMYGIYSVDILLVNFKATTCYIQGNWW